MPSIGKEDGAGCPASEVTMDDENFRTGGLKGLLPPQEAGLWEGWSDPLPEPSASRSGLGHLWSCSCSSSFA